MSQYNIGPKIGIEGEREFRAQISRINSEYRSMESYLKALEKSMDQNGRSQEALASKSNVLRQQLSLQEQRYAALEDALSKATKKFGAGSDEVMRFQGALLDVDNTVAALKKELDSTESELRDLSRGVDVVGDSAKTAEKQTMSFGDMLKSGIASGVILNVLEEVGEIIVDIGKDAIEAAADVNAANAQFSQTFGNLKGQASAALDSISDKTGIAVTRLQSGYTALYAFVKSVGGDQETALNIAQRAMKAAADSAAYYDRSMEDATETLQSFLKGNYENDAALGIAATETTRNAKANELYAKSFKELSEAQKVDVLLAMVEAGNAASGALGQAAREADSWTNVTGELAEAWRQLLAQLGSPVIEGLSPVIQSITEGLEGVAEQSSFQTLADSTAQFRDGLAAADAALDDSNSKIAATSELAIQYVKQLEAIEKAGLDSADAQRDYAQVVELLNTLMPELNLTINKHTGQLNQDTSAIRANIIALSNQAKEQAKQSYYKKILDEMAAAEEALIDAQIREKELLAEKEILLARGAQEYDNLTYSQTGSTAAMDAFNASLSEDDRALAAVNVELSALNGTMKTHEAAIAASSDKLNAATAALEDYGDASDDASEAADKQAEAQKDLADAFSAAKAEAESNINSQMGLFDELASKNEWSAEKIIENWKKQREAFANYEDNLKAAVDMGLDEALVQQLSDGSQQSMMILDELVNGTELSVDEINAAFRDRMDAEDSLSDHLGQMEVIASGQFDSIVKDAKGTGRDIVEGAANGIINNIGKYETALKRLANRGQKTYEREWSIQSPSRWMMGRSDYIVDGATIQLDRRGPDMARAMADLAHAGQVAYQDQLDHVAQYPSIMQGVPGYGTSTTTNNRSVAYGGINITINAQAGQDSHSIADAVLEELTVRLGQEEAAF